MFYNWLDRWDEKRARKGEESKVKAAFRLGAERAFPNSMGVRTVKAFCDLAERATATPSFYRLPHGDEPEFERDGEFLKFQSDIVTDVDENNLVWAKITESRSSEKALVIFHHWNASGYNRQIASFFSRRGITVAEIAMPYHLQRSRSDSHYADYMLSPNLGRTIQAIRQAVWEGQRLIAWLKGQGYREISVLGMSLGSWVAGLVAAHNANVSKASLFLTAGSLADMVWTGRATQSIRESLEPEMTLNDLRKAWAPLNLENYVHSLARADLDIQIILAKRDKVVMPELSQSFIHRLNNAAAQPKILQLNCGHYSLAIPPYILMAGLSLKRFLS